MTREKENKIKTIQFIDSVWIDQFVCKKKIDGKSSSPPSEKDEKRDFSQFILKSRMGEAKRVIAKLNDERNDRTIL